MQSAPVSRLASLFIALLVSQAVGGEIRVRGQASIKTQVLAPARIAGAMKSLKVSEGQLVVAGQELAALDDAIAASDYQAAKHEAHVFALQKDNDIDLRLSAKSRAVSERELERSRAANSRFADAVSKTELERLSLLVEQAALSEEKAALDLKVADANYRLKSTLVEAAKHRMDLHRIVSPMDGMVVGIEVQEGEWVDQGKPVMRILQLHVLRVEAHVDGTQYGSELLGAAASFESTHQGTSQTHQGKVVFVSPELNSVDGTIRVWTDMATPKHMLKPGMQGTLIIQVDEP